MPPNAPRRGLAVALVMVIAIFAVAAYAQEVQAPAGSSSPGLFSGIGSMLREALAEILMAAGAALVIYVRSKLAAKAVEAEKSKGAMYQTGLRIAVAFAESLSKHMTTKRCLDCPPGGRCNACAEDARIAEERKSQARAASSHAGVEGVVAPEVYRVTKSELKAVDDDGNIIEARLVPPAPAPAPVLRPAAPPRLSVLIVAGALLLGAAGCASPAMKSSADTLRRKVRTLIAATEPRHEYDAAGRASVDRLAYKTIEHADKLAASCGLPPLTEAEERAAFSGEESLQIGRAHV